MPKVSFTSALQRFFPDLNTVEVEGTTIHAVIEQINEQYPGLKDYIVDEQGQVRKHVNIYVGKELINDRNALSDEVGETQEVFILQALSGG